MNIFIVMFLVVLCGCATANVDNQSGERKSETIQEQKSALLAVVGAVSDKDLTEKDLKNLVKDIKNDEEAKTAIQSITDSLSNKSHSVKYCPITGRRYAPKVNICPEHNVDLKWVE